MPPGKRRQSNAMLYTLITFIGLFIIATTVAVIYYVRAEELRTSAADLQDQMDDLASNEELRLLGNIVGPKLPGQSRLGTMVSHLDRMVKLIKGAPVPPTVNAEVKVGTAMDAVVPVLANARNYVPLRTAEPNAATPDAIDPNQIALTLVMGDLLTELQQTIELQNATQQQLTDLRGRYDGAIATMQQSEEELTAKVEQYRQQVQEIKSDYNDLRLLVEQSSEQRVENLLSQLDQEKANSRQLNQELLRTQAEWNVAQERLADAMAKVGEIKPPPDEEAAARTPDGKVVLVDETAGVVTLDLGSDDRVYRGLTFSIYDRTGGIPEDGKPKAEVEIFAVDKKVSTARILSSNAKNPITTGDVAANLIWDRQKDNQFVIVGEFDLNEDGEPEYDAIRRIGDLIQKWGGTIAEDVSARTDFVLLGTEPKVPPQPSLEILAVDPTATEKYNAATQRRQRYEEVQRRAQALWIPIFNYDRFLHFTGYASHVGKAGAF